MYFITNISAYCNCNLEIKQFVYLLYHVMLKYHMNANITRYNQKMRPIRGEIHILIGVSKYTSKLLTFSSIYLLLSLKIANKSKDNTIFNEIFKLTSQTGSVSRLCIEIKTLLIVNANDQLFPMESKPISPCLEMFG